MMRSLKIRCKKCGKILVAKCTENRSKGSCPGCKTTLIIPGVAEIEGRRSERALIAENSLGIQPSAELSASKDKPCFRVIYTEAPAFEFAHKRRGVSPILDLSDSGLSFLVRHDEAGDKLVAGQVFAIEMDCPLFVQPIYPMVQVRWANPSGDDLFHVGVTFHSPPHDLQNIIANLIKYILAKPEAWEAVVLDGD